MQRFDNIEGIELHSTLVDIPQGYQNIDIEIPTHNNSNNKKPMVVSGGKMLGKVERVQKTTVITANILETKTSGETKQTFLDSFKDDAENWATYEQQMKRLLWKHRNVFAMTHHELGKCNITEHRI